MKKFSSKYGFLCGLGAVAVLGLAGCEQQEQDTVVTNTTTTPATNTVTNGATDTTTNSATEDGTARVQKAVAVLHPTEGNKVRGTVTFTQEEGGVRIVADVTGLTPGAEHGFHAHEHGDCSADDASSAGGHYNPTNMPHGSPDDVQRHVGDFGNMKPDDSGRARYDRLDTMVTLEGPNSIIGRGVIVHSKADDFKTQPTGDAGDRLACGVVGVATNQEKES